MSNQPTTTAPLEPAQVPASTGTAGSGTPAQPEGFIRDEVMAMLAKVRAEAEESATRRAQSYIDTRYGKVGQEMKNLESVLAKLKAEGVEIDPAKQEKWRQDAIQSAFTGDPSPQPPQQAGQPGGDGGEDDPVTQIDIGFERRYGVEITTSDPEAELIKADASQEDYLETYLQAIAAKKQRLQQTVQPAPSAGAAHTPTNLGGLGGAAPTVRTISVESARETLAKGLSKR